MIPYRYRLPPTRLVSLLSLVSCIVLLVSCHPAPPVTYEPATLTIATTPACEPLLTDLRDVYQAEYPAISFKLIRSDHGAAMEAVLSGAVDLAAVGQISATETIWLTAVAIDNLAIIVHPSNPIQELTLLQLRDIFLGRNSSWSRFGGGSEEITIITRERGSEIRADLEAHVLEGRNVTLNAVIAPSAQAMLEQVSTTPTAIGYISMGYRPTGVKLLAIEGVLPTPLTATNRTYPLYRTLYFVAAQEPDAESEKPLRDFVAWVLGPQGQAVVGQRYGRVR